MDEKKLIRFFNQINNIMNIVYDENGRQTKWFYCFGTLLEYIADRTFSLKFDIDIGMIYKKCNYKALVAAAQGFGFELAGKVLHDADKLPLNLHFDPTEKGLPTLDIYFWIQSGNMLYHTYDVNHENRSVLSEYVFKGVPARHILPPQEEIDIIRKSGPEKDQLLTKDGVWKFDIFGDHSGHVFRCPFEPGSLLDIWYPGWRFRQYHKGQSVTRTEWKKKVRSCNQLS